MRGTGPAAAAAGVTALAWVVWEVWRFAWQRRIVAGIKGLYVFEWDGPGAVAYPDGGAFTLVVLPVVIALVGLVVAAAVAWRARAGSVRFGPALLGLGALGQIAWATFIGVVALGTTFDDWLQLPVFVVSWEEPFSWSPWSRWILDGGALAAIALLLGFGPDTAPARRALWIAALAVLADSGWRVAVVVLAGQVPMLASGIGVLGVGQLVVWVLLAGLAVGFLALFANVPEAAGPRRIAVLAALGGSGLWLGVQGALLWGSGLFARLGMQPTLVWPMPEYEGLLAGLRLVLLAVGCASLGLAVWRAGPDDPA
jgi:hypothetical protein